MPAHPHHPFPQYSIVFSSRPFLALFPPVLALIPRDIRTIYPTKRRSFYAALLLLGASCDKVWVIETYKFDNVFFSNVSSYFHTLILLLLVKLGRYELWSMGTIVEFLCTSFKSRTHLLTPPKLFRLLPFVLFFFLPPLFSFLCVCSGIIFPDVCICVLLVSSHPIPDSRD